MINEFSQHSGMPHFLGSNHYHDFSIFHWRWRQSPSTPSWNHEVATVTKKQKPQLFSSLIKRANISLWISANQEQVSMSFQIIDKLPVKQKALIQFKQSSLGARAGGRQKRRRESQRTRQNANSTLQGYELSPDMGEPCLHALLSYPVSLPSGRDFSSQPPKKTNTGHTLNINPVLKLCTNSNDSGIQTEEYFNNLEFEKSF